jgi:pantothenate kinase
MLQTTSTRYGFVITFDTQAFINMTELILALPTQRHIGVFVFNH